MENIMGNKNVIEKHLKLHQNSVLEAKNKLRNLKNMPKNKHICSDNNNNIFTEKEKKEIEKWLQTRNYNKMFSHISQNELVRLEQEERKWKTAVKAEQKKLQKYFCDNTDNDDNGDIDSTTNTPKKKI